MTAKRIMYEIRGNRLFQMYLPDTDISSKKTLNRKYLFNVSSHWLCHVSPNCRLWTLLILSSSLQISKMLTVNEENAMKTEAMRSCRWMRSCSIWSRVRTKSFTIVEGLLLTWVTLTRRGSSAMVLMDKELHHNSEFTTSTNQRESWQAATTSQASTKTNSTHQNAIVTMVEQEEFLSIPAWSWTAWMVWMQMVWTALSDVPASSATSSVTTCINCGAFLNFNKTLFDPLPKWLDE